MRGVTNRARAPRAAVVGVGGEQATPSYPQLREPGKAATGITSTAV